jgi:hypothetical protein
MGDRTLKFCFGNKEDAQFHFWEYINGNQTFILDSQPLICSENFSFIWNKNAIFRSHSPAAPSGPAATAVETPPPPESKV